MKERINDEVETQLETANKVCRTILARLREYAETEGIMLDSINLIATFRAKDGDTYRCGEAYGNTFAVVASTEQWLQEVASLHEETELEGEETDFE